MRKREAGQAFILVLIFLAIGALMVVPTLRLTSTALQNTPLVTGREKAIYAVDAGQEYVLWKLLYDNYGSQFTPTNDTGYLSLDVCGIPVNIVVVMRAVPGEGGLILAGEDVIKPTKTVIHQYLPDPVPDKRWVEYTYIIELEQISENTTQGLDAIFDIPPIGITEYLGPTEISLDQGLTWQVVPDPFWDAAKGYFKWPADYDKDTSTGTFSSDPGDTSHYFGGIREFTPGQIKKLRFKVWGRLDNNQVHCNWVVLKPWNTVSGPQAPINVGNPTDPGVCASDDVIEVFKISDPDVIQAGVETDITYTISLTNNYIQTRQIESLIDYLPPDFEYVGPTSGNVTADPEVTLENANGVMRYKLLWTTPQFGGTDLTIVSNETLIITFMAKGTKEVSGSYYNELYAILKETGLPSQAFAEVGVTPGEYASNYSWNTGSVTVPTYDSSSDAGGVVIDSNLALVFGGITITSYNWR